MGKYSIHQQKFISDYRILHKVPVILDDEVVVEMIKEEMIKTGKLYPEFASLLDKKPNKTKNNNSLFELYNNNQDYVSDRLEKLSQKPKTEIKTKKTYLPQERAVARKYIAAMLKNQIMDAIFGEQGFNVISKPNKISGAEAWQELETAGAFLVHNLRLGQLGIEEPLNRDGLAKDLNTAFRQIEELEVLVDYPKAFDKKYKEITHGKSLDYSAVIDYLQAVNEHQSAYMQDKLSTLEKLKEPAKRFEKTLNIPAIKDFDKWAGRQETGGSLTSLAIDMALAYMSGGMSAVGNAAMKTGQSVTKAVTAQAMKQGVKKETAEIAGQVAGITTSQVTGAGLNSAMFQATRTAGALEDGNITVQEFEEIGLSYVGLFKFGYVGSAISGPMGAKFGEWVGRLINNDKTISVILNSSLKQPTTLGKVLKNLSENSRLIQKTVEFGTSFAINTEYMAQDEGIGFTEALENLAQMEGVSKIVMAFLGGKTTKFLTPEKVQKITTELNNCKVETVVYKGQKAIKVITLDGKENFFSSHEELIAFVADKVYTTAGVELNETKNNSAGIKAGVNQGVNQGVKTKSQEKTAPRTAVRSQVTPKTNKSYPKEGSEVVASHSENTVTSAVDPKIAKTVAEVRGQKIVETKLDAEIERSVRKNLLDGYEKIESPKGKEVDSMIFDLMKDINDNSQIDKGKVKAIRRELKLLTQTNPQEAANLELVLEARITTKKGSEATREEIAAVVQHLRRQFELEKEKITAKLEEFGAKNLGTFTNRVKSDMSETDKITNYALNHPDEPFEMAIRDVRDNYGGRIEISATDIINNSIELQKLLQAGNLDETARVAMEQVSGKIVGFMREIIHDSEHFFEITRVSNYKDSADISTLDETTMFKLQKEAHDSGMPIVIEHWKIKQQGSAYPAFQVNIRTKTGKVIEIQIRLDEVGNYAEIEHYIYDLMTGKDIIGRKEKVAPLFAPLEKSLRENLTEAEYKTYYLPYTRAQYHYRLLKAFGINTPEPKLEDFLPPPGKTFDPRLKAENLFLLHKLEKDVLANKLTADQALEVYNKAVEKSDNS